MYSYNRNLGKITSKGTGIEDERDANQALQKRCRIERNEKERIKERERARPRKHNQIRGEIRNKIFSYQANKYS